MTDPMTPQPCRCNGGSTICPGCQASVTTIDTSPVTPDEIRQAVEAIKKTLTGLGVSKILVDGSIHLKRLLAHANWLEKYEKEQP